MTGDRRIPVRTLLQALAVVVLLPFLPLLISGRWHWRAGWVYWVASVLGFVVSRVLASRRHPDLIAELAHFRQFEDVKAWDRTLSRWLLVGSVLVMVVSGLDALLNWTPGHSLALKVVALVVLLAGYALSSYALIENRFFSAVVRIQTERGQQVVSSGPYRWVRHPGYAGGLLVYLATPALLSAVWAYVPTAIVVALTVLRTSLEDHTLQAELPGYREYAEHVPFRLLPGIW